MSNFVQSFENLLQNKYVATVLIVFFILYGSVIAPKLSLNAAKLFDNTFVKIAVFFLIAYLATFNPVIAIVCALAVFLSLQTLNKYTMTEKFMQHLNYRPAPVEHMSNSDNQVGMIKDENNVAVKNVEGNYMDKPCDNVVQDDASIYVNDNDHGKNTYGVYHDKDDKQFQDMNMVCNGSSCYDGFDKGNDLASF